MEFLKQEKAVSFYTLTAFHFSVSFPVNGSRGRAQSALARLSERYGNLGVNGKKSFQLKNVPCVL